MSWLRQPSPRVPLPAWQGQQAQDPVAMRAAIAARAREMLATSSSQPPDEADWARPPRHPSLSALRPPQVVPPPAKRPKFSAPVPTLRPSEYLQAKGAGKGWRPPAAQWRGAQLPGNVFRPGHRTQDTLPEDHGQEDQEPWPEDDEFANNEADWYQKAAEGREDCPAWDESGAVKEEEEEVWGVDPHEQTTTASDGAGPMNHRRSESSDLSSHGYGIVRPPVQLGVPKRSAPWLPKASPKLSGLTRPPLSRPPMPRPGLRYAGPSFGARPDLDEAPRPKFGGVMPPQHLSARPKGCPSSKGWSQPSAGSVQKHNQSQGDGSWASLWDPDEEARKGEPEEQEVSRTIEVPNEIVETVISDLSSTEFKVLFEIKESIFDEVPTKVIFGPGPAELVDEAVTMLAEHIEDLMSNVVAEVIPEEVVPETPEPDAKAKARAPSAQVRSPSASPEASAAPGRPPVPARRAPVAGPHFEAPRAKAAAPKTGGGKPVAAPPKSLGVLDDEPDELPDEEPDTEPAPGAESEAAPASPKPARVGLNSPSSEPGSPVAVLLPTTAAATGSESVAPAEATSPPREVQLREPEKMTVEDWMNTQDQFSHLPPLPQNWIRIRASNGSVYYLHLTTGKSSMDMPQELPAGWEKVISRSTGKVYYRNIQLGASQFEPPAA